MPTDVVQLAHNKRSPEARSTPAELLTDIRLYHGDRLMAQYKPFPPFPNIGRYRFQRLEAV